jgi:hypothetical protein
MQQASGDDDVVPGMVSAPQTFGELAHLHPYVLAIAHDGVFDKDGHFVNGSDVDLNRCVVL